MIIKKIIAIIMCFLFCFCMLTVCSYKENLLDKSKVNKNITTTTTNVANYGYTISDRKEKYVYDGNQIEIPIEINNLQAPIEVGIMFFIDGIPQIISFKEDENSSEEYVKSINLPKESKVIKTAVFTPTVGKEGDILKLHVTSMLNPSYIPRGENKNFGVHHSMIDIIPVELEYKKDAVKVDYKGSILKSIIMTKETKKEFQIDEEPYNNIQLNSDDVGRYNGLPFLDYVKGDNLNLRLSAYGKNSVKYRTTIFINHLPVKTMNGYDYYDFSIQKDCLSRIDFLINGDEILKNNSFIYAVSVPMERDAEINACIKSKSKLLLTKSEAELFLNKNKK